MRKWLGMAVAGLVALACVGTAQAKHYALCTGLNQYKSSYVSSDSWLNGCVPDAKNVYTNITLRGEWTTSDATQFLNSAGTFAAVSNKLMEFASAAVSGDVVLYYHSSHGYQDSGKNTGICMYDKDMPDSSFAKILANFKSGVKVIIVLDTCHSGGMFKSLRRDGSTRDLDTGSPFTFAERVNEELAAIRADEAARGIKAAKLAVLDCAWVTAADYNQYSWDGDEGGAFTECYVGSVKSGACDKSPYGNGDSYATFKEMFDYAVAQDDTHGDGKPGSEDYTMPQCTNTTILAAVRFGWVGKEAPTGVRFDPIPEQTATAGEEMTYTLTASNSDGSSGKITFSVASSTAPAGSYSLDSSSGAFSFTPPTDGTFSFSFLGTNATAHTDGKANMTVTASLAAPAKLSNSGITVSSFTANWGAVAGASSYVLEVFADDSGASATAKGSDDAFRLVTSADELTEGEYVILADGTDVAMNNTCSGSSSGYLSCTDVSVEDSAVSTDDASIIWTLAGDAASCTLFNAAAGKFVNPATTKSIGWASDASGAWTLSLANGLVSAENAKDTSWVLQYNAGSPRFMCYSSKQKLLRFFRRDGASGAVFSGDVGNVTSFTVTDLIPGDYTWRVRAIGNAKGPFSDVQEVSLVADPTAPPSIRAIADEEILVGEPLYIPVRVSAPEEAPVTSLEITAGDTAAKLGEDGIFSFIPEAPGTYDFTITAVNANGSASEDFTVTATLPEPVTPEVPAVVDSEGFTAVWTPVAGAESYELVVIEGKGGSGGGGGGGGGSGETLTETFANAEFSPGGGSYGSQTISGCDLGTWTATESRGDKGTPVFRAGGTLTSPSIAGGVASVEFDYVWPFSESGACDIDLYVGGTKVDSASVTGGTPGTASYASFAAVAGATSIEFRNTGSSNKRIQVNQVRIGTASKSIARAVGDVVYSNNVGNVTSFDVTGLQPNTEYTFAFRAIAGDEATDWSEPVSVMTADGPSAPAWSAIPAQNTYVGATFQLDLTPYLAGSPLPTVTADVGTVTGLHYVYAPEATGPVTVTLTASNDSGSDQTTFVLAVAEAPVGGNHYAVVVGCNKYDTEYVDSNNWLNGCVPDANHVHSLITTRGEWEAANVTKLTDSAAKHDAIRAAIASAASKAVAGDTFLYFHSSHGGNYTYTFVTNTALYTDWPIMVYDVDPEGIDNCICSYDADYPAAELAADLAAFDPAVNIVVMIDACHSAGMYKYDTAPTSGRVVRRNAVGAAMRSAHPAVFAGAVEEQLGAIRRARGIRAAAANVGFVTAADFDEYSYDSQSGDGGEFTTAFIEGVTNGLCDGADYGDQDGYASFYEGWNYAKDIAVGIPVGTVVDDDGHKVDANGYALYDNSYYAEYYDEPEYYYDYYFTHAQITNEAVLRAVRVGYAGNPTLAAPVANPAADVTASSFTASWSAVADAAAYRLQVATDPSFSGGAASDTLTADDFTATSTSYTEFSDVAKDSGAVYAGKSARNTDGAIQLNNSTTTQAGIWTTASGGNASRVSVEWSDATTTSKPRSVQVYGSSTALASYADVKSATLLGSITYGSSTALDITDSCAYVGILANGGALYLNSVTIDWGAAGSESSIVLDENVGTDTSVEVSGLEAETDYYYRVQALGGPVDSDFSNVISLTTDGGVPTAPAWDTIPPQTVAAGQNLVVDLNAYVSGSPKPTITADAGTVEAGVLTVSYAAAGGYTIALTAENSEGTASATLEVEVTAAPVTVPVLTLSNPQESSFDADWTACSGATEYQFQVATDDQFTPGGGGGGSGDFTLVTSVAGFTAGEYVILADGTDTAMNSTYSGTSSKYLSCTDVTVSGNTVSTEDASIIWTLAGDASSCTLFNGDAGKYVNPAASKTVGWADTASGSWTLSVTEDGIVTAANADDTSWVLQYNSGSPRFMCYSSSQKKLRFFRRGAAKSAAKDDGSLLIDTTTNGLSLTVTGLEPDTTYYARVRMAGGEWSAVGSIATTGEGPAGPAKYAVCVGLSEYDMAAFEEMGLKVTPLKGCVNDATYLKASLTERGGWAEGNVALLTNGSATKDAIRGAIAAAAAKAKAGDTFVYEHSSHGLQGDEDDDYTAALATYNDLYNDTELAEDLAAFADGVKVVILIDACHSAGMIDDGGDAGAGTASKARPAAAFDIARRVSALIDANRAARKARGEDVARTLSSDQIGWVTAAAYDETSKDGGYYDTDEWMSDDEADGEERGGAFLASVAWGWWTGKADVSGEGDGDGWFDAYEGWSFSTPVCAEFDQTPQYLNADVLRSVELGWVGGAAPSADILFDDLPGAEVAIGEEATLTVAAHNADGTTEGIVLDIAATAPEGLEYTFEDGTLAFTPAEDGLFLFTVQAVNGGASATKILGVTAVLPAPVAQEVDDADIAEDGFTARWLGVDAARKYQIQVSTDPDFPMGEPEELIEEGFDDVTDKASLPDGWEFTGTFGTYATGGEAAPSIKLSTDGATLTTPSFTLTGKEAGLSFWVKGNGSGTNMTSTLTVQQLVGEEWQTLKNGTFVPSTAGETKEFEELDANATRIRFVMAKTSGNIALDDVMVAQLATPVVVDNDKIPADATSFAVEGLEPGTTYYFHVRALANTKSAWSETIEVTTAGEKPLPVPDLTVMAPETSPDTSLAAFWVCTGAEEFRLQVATDEAFATLVYDETMTQIAMTVTGLLPDTTYYVRVCALDGDRAGDWSNVESITTEAGGEPEEGPSIGGEGSDVEIDAGSFTSKKLSAKVSDELAATFDDAQLQYATEVVEGAWNWSEENVIENTAEWPNLEFDLDSLGLDQAVFRLDFLDNE